MKSNRMTWGLKLKYLNFKAKLNNSSLCQKKKRKRKKKKNKRKRRSQKKRKGKMMKKGKRKKMKISKGKSKFKTTEHFLINKSGWIDSLKSSNLLLKIPSVMQRKVKNKRVLLTFVSFLKIYGNKESKCRKKNSRSLLSISISSANRQNNFRSS